MPGCIPIGPINPFNQAIIAAFGENFYPPFNAGYQPADKAAMVSEKLLQFQLPAGGKIKPTGQPYTNINETLTTLLGPIGSIMSGFAPIFIILDLIRGILDIICALFNPIPVVESVVDLFLNVIPPVISILPPVAAILLAIDIIKLIVAIVVSLLSSLIPIIDQILECGNKIPNDISSGNFAAVDGCAQRICQLLQLFLNEIGALGPISFILEMLDTIMGLGAKFFCAAEAECCNPSNCPPIINDPSVGTATVLSSQEGINLIDTVGIDLEIIPPSTVLSAPQNPELANLKPYIYDPTKLNPTQEDTAAGRDPATIRIRINNTLYGVTDAGVGTITIRASGFTIDSSVDFEIVPDQTQLLLNNLIGLGCLDDIVAATTAARNGANNDSGLNNGGGGALTPLVLKTGFIPRPTVLEAKLRAAHDAIAADPTLDVTGDVNDAVTEYLGQLTSFYEDVVCSGASRTSTDFSSTKAYVVADGSDSAQVSLKVTERSGANLLDAQLPNTNFNVIISSTVGTVGPVVFDPSDSTYKASITSDSSGIAEISATFLVGNQECIKPGTFDGTNIVDKVLNIEFVAPAGQYPRRRRENQYVQSSGGRRRP